VSAIRPVLSVLEAEIGELTERLGRRVAVSDLKVTSRRGQLDLDPPGTRTSCNRACRLLRAGDGWMALNLARPEDRELVAAWLGRNAPADDPWAAVEAHVGDFACAELVERAALLGLPAAAVGEVKHDVLAAPLLSLGRRERRDRTPRVLDLSALWAGPMCGAILAAMGWTVSKVESAERPDPTRDATPEFARRLNGRKMHLSFDFGLAQGRARLRDLVAGADVLITGARPRAFAGLGLEPDAVFDANPGLVWVAVTGYGWTGAGAGRVAFGDDAAAAGGLVGWDDGAPHFLGDALADPVTGMAAAAGALRGLDQGGGVLVDVALARSAAGAASHLGLAA
jgi:crotonobetainyl-CoA:carnitine CoA-transferase CaiB-like acyl-CoA transferase